MRAISLHQPWASLVAMGVKTVETRSWATTYRGRLAIHAAAVPPRQWEQVGAYRSALPSGLARAQIDRAWLIDLSGPTQRVTPMPLGAIVATCELLDCVPIVCKPRRNDERLPVSRDGDRVMRGSWNGCWELPGQLPYGDFRPGRVAWLLGDIKPTTERCPACWGEGFTPEQTACSDPEHCSETTLCCVCDVDGVCAPIPAKGRQRFWEWTP